MTPDPLLELDSLARCLPNLRAAVEAQSAANSVLLQCVVDEWADAKFAGDFIRADKLREVLRSAAVEPLMGTKYYRLELVETELPGHYRRKDLPKHVVGNPVGNTWRRIL